MATTIDNVTLWDGHRGKLCTRWKSGDDMATLSFCPFVAGRIATGPEERMARVLGIVPRVIIQLVVASHACG